MGLRIKENVTTNQCKKGETWEGEGLKYHGKLMTSYMEGPLDFLPSVFGTKVTCYLTITMHQFGGNQKSAYYRSHNRVKSFQKEHFYFKLPAFLQQTETKKDSGLASQKFPALVCISFHQRY